MEIETIDFDLHSLIAELVVTMAVQAHAKGLELSCRIDPNVPALLRGDPGRLRQILTNLSTAGPHHQGGFGQRGRRAASKRGPSGGNGGPGRGSEPSCIAHP
jgi:signal transduction histidine kinase